MAKTPLLICAYRSRYLDAVLNWLASEGIEEKYQVFVWDNGGARQIAAEYGFETHGLGATESAEPRNVGKAIAMQYLVDIVTKALPDATCYVCMDDDVIVDYEHLDALVSAAHRPSIGMVAARFHPFNSVMPAGGSIVEFDPCPVCSASKPSARCLHCRGSGKNPQGLRLRTYPVEDRTVLNVGRVAGTLFAVSKAAVAETKYAPYLYPILTRQGDNSPIVYWSEDATLDVALTSEGYTNGYLEMPHLTPAIHLPELDHEYMQWKLKAREEPPIEGFKSKKEARDG
jgi:Glycosyl transferase family 2